MSLFRRAGAEIMRIIKQAADPGGLANRVQVYVKADGGGTSQLFAQDSAGNVYQLTPSGLFGGLTITPAAIAGGNNDYNPANLSTASTIRQDLSATATLTGLTAQGNNFETALVNITNTQANILTLTHEDGASIATNRFSLPSNLNWLIPRNGSVRLRYDSTSARWRSVGMSSNVMPAGDVNNPGLVVGVTLNRGLFDVGASTNTTNGGVTVATFSAGVGVTGALAQSGGQVTFNTGSSGFINTGPFSTSNVILSTGVTSPANLTGGTTNDYSPANASTNTTFRQNATLPSTVTGFNANTNTNGRLIIIHNISTVLANTITFTHEDAGSTAANRFNLPAQVSLVVTAGGSATFRYDSTSSRWRVIDNL